MGDSSGPCEDPLRMPWKEAHTVDLRFELVNLIYRDGVPVTAAAEAFGVSRKTAHKWLARFEQEGRDKSQ